MIKPALLLLASFTLGTAPAPQDYGKDMAAADRAACVAKGGAVQRLGMLQHESCVVRLKDAGKRCKSDGDCQGACWLDEKIDYQTLKPGQRVRGQCQPTSDGFGCHSLVEKGRYAGTLCAD
ncbi:MAG: hypothetical protein V4808_08960 [Pseudomonadota bacterium]